MVPRGVLALALVVLSALAACTSPSSAGPGGKLLVVTSVSPITDIAKSIVGTAADVQGLIPEGVDSHTFEPTTQSAELLSHADAIFLNGLDLEDPPLKLAQSNHKDGATIFLLGTHTITRSQYIYDFSFPRAGGKPNPHLWMDVEYAIRYAQLIEQQMVRIDPKHASVYRANAARYLPVLRRLNSAIATAAQTIPPQNRKLLTFHDSFAYFAHHYGMTVIGAIQPSDFSEPSAQEVARLINQIKAEHVPAIFGSEVFPSPVLGEIASETGAKYESTLRDDDLPGTADGPMHSYVGLMVYDVRTMVSDLGGDPSALNGIPTKSPYD